MRCFVALAPSPAARAALEALMVACAERHPGARCMRAANLHLTLAFIGELDAAAADAVAAALAALPAPELDLCIDRVGEFGRARVLWAGGPDNPALDALAARVRDLLEGLQVPHDRRGFVPHITLLRDLQPGSGASEPEFAPITWRPAPPQLYCSSHDARGTLLYAPWPAPGRAP